MCFLFFFFSSRRRHTRCALVTGVQTCALPIWRPAHIHLSLFGPSFATRLVTQLYFPGDPLLAFDPIHNAVPAGARERLIRSEERRVGKACVSTCRSWWSPYHSKKKLSNKLHYIYVRQQKCKIRAKVKS